VNSAGDSVLAEFASVVEAVNCAVEIQAGLKSENASLARERRMEFRIGVNLGDVMVEGEQIYGDGVNVAARLESLAEPGGICVSDTVYAQIRTS
jgi:adenylate cyclase